MTLKNFVYENKNLSKLLRLRISENRDLKNGICLNRNERVENFSKDLILKIFKNSKNIYLGKYPNQELIYIQLEKYLKISRNNILLSSGIDGSLKTIFEIFLKKNDKIAFIKPSYAMYEVYANVFKCKALEISYDYKNFKLNKKDIYAVIEKGIKILFLPNPNQPIEDNISLREMVRICNFCRKKKVLLVVDEAYFMFGSQTAISLIKKFENIIILRTFSKSFGLPAIRLGFILSNKKLISILSSYRLSYESNVLTDTVAIYFLKNKNLFQSYIKKIIQGRNFLINELNKLKFQTIGKYSNFLLIKFNNQFLAKKIYVSLFKKKIYVKGNYHGPLSDCILLTCGPRKIMKMVLKEIKNIIKC